MDRISKHIAQKFVDKLPEDDQYYRLGDLRQMGFPGFVVKRIKVELERNLAESIVPPKTDWANMNSNAVQDAWSHFIAAIRAEARLPASYASSIIETAVDDIIELLVQPRINLPDIIFGPTDELSYDEVVERMDVIVVYGHFASLIPRYMQKKGLKSLKKGRCAEIIIKADEKLTKRYTPLNWAQMLEPLFTLMDEQIDSNLLRLFFEDKKMPRIARGFDMMNRSLNRAELIEVLSSPELLNLDDDQSQGTLFKKGAKPDPEDLIGPVQPYREKEAVPGEDSDQVASESTFGKQELEQEQDAVDELDRTGSESKRLEGDSDPIISSFHESRDRKTVNVDEDFSLNKAFSSGEDEEEDSDDRTYTVEEFEEEQSLNAAFLEDPDDEHTSEDIAGAEADNEPAIETDEDENENGYQYRPEQYDEELERDTEEDVDDNENGSEYQAENGNTPMWQRFMSLDTDADTDLDSEIEEDRPVEEEEFIDEPVIDLTENDEPDPERLKRLNKMLDDDRERFVEEIFRGADEAYEEAVREIAGKDNWRSASRYIEKEVYKRNLVDMYSETAVDFTDRLQTFFIESGNSN